MTTFDRVFLSILFYAVVCFFWMAVMEPGMNIPLVPLGVIFGISTAVLFVIFGPKPVNNSKKDAGSR